MDGREDDDKDEGGSQSTDQGRARPVRRWNMDVFDCLRLMSPEALAQELASESPDADIELALALLDARARPDAHGDTPLLSCGRHLNADLGLSLLLL